MRNEIWELIREFRESKIMHLRGIEAGDSEAAEKGASGYIRAAEALLKVGDPGIEAFAILLQDEIIAVRTAAATYLLPHRTEKAIAVLKEGSNGKGLSAFAAKIALKRWEGGEEKVWEEIKSLSQSAKVPKRRKNWAKPE